MALHRFLGMEIGVPEPGRLASFYQSIGLLGAGDRWGTADMPGQIQICEAGYRQLRAIHVGCDDEADLAAIAARLADMGVASSRQGGALRCVHPGHGWVVRVEPAPRADIGRQPEPLRNAPGARARSNARAEVVLEQKARPPRRLAHVVVGSPDPPAAVRFFHEGIGFRISDVVGGIATFMRCSTDHHNLLVQPSPVPYINHYAFEFDDIDAVGAAASDHLTGLDDDRHVLGIGRHVVGANVFWYMRDPCGTMFEFFSDMDDIPDDDSWEIGRDFPPDAFARWGPREPPMSFFFPEDLPAIAKAREAEGL